MLEIFGSSAREMLVRSTYEMVYMMSATGMMRSQRWWVMGKWCWNRISSATKNFFAGPLRGGDTISVHVLIRTRKDFWCDEEDGGSGGARTRNLCRDRAAL